MQNDNITKQFFVTTSSSSLIITQFINEPWSSDSVRWIIYDLFLLPDGEFLACVQTLFSKLFFDRDEAYKWLHQNTKLFQIFYSSSKNFDASKQEKLVHYLLKVAKVKDEYLED